MNTSINIDFEIPAELKKEMDLADKVYEEYGSDSLEYQECVEQIEIMAPLFFFENKLTENHAASIMKRYNLL